MFFLKIGERTNILSLLSTLIRHENAVLFLRLGLPPTLIRHEHGAKTLFNSKEFENTGLTETVF